MNEEKEDLHKKIADLEKRFSALNEYLSRSGEVMVDTVMRHAALEKIMIDKGIITEKEIQDKVAENVKNVIEKNNEVLMGDPNGD